MKDRFGCPTDYLVISELQKLMREGVTAVLEAVNELSVSVSDLTEVLSGELGAQSTANAYVSFRDTSGFGAHNDDHDVVVLRIDGEKNGDSSDRQVTPKWQRSTILMHLPHLIWVRKSSCRPAM